MHKQYIHNIDKKCSDVICNKQMLHKIIIKESTYLYTLLDFRIQKLKILI